MSISQVDFDFIRTMVCKASGIVLEDGKEYLVEACLGPLARQMKLAGVDALVDTLRISRVGDDLRTRVVEAMTTNETTFFRDRAPFDVLKQHIIPALLEARKSTRKLTIWSAAASTGQEPYSLAILLADHFSQLERWDIRIIASDLSLEVLERAQRARYSQLEVNRGLPLSYLMKYFEKHGLEWQLKEPVRRRVSFEQLNLVQDWPSWPQLDIVLLRNVMIYFDVETKKTILKKVRQLLRRDGYLFLGAAETTVSLDERFERLKYDRAGCYGLVAAA
jgi:chemotaxis protein methyltransferase CheR